jgi:hypothetical protein
MFCPKCAAQNLEDARFCRSCGTDISLVPLALTGQLAARLAAADEAQALGSRRARDEYKRPPSIERAVKSLFMGLAFIFIAFAVRTWAPAGSIWWFWMFLPAAMLLSDGVAGFMRLSAERAERRGTAPQPNAPAQTSVPPPHRAGELPAPVTGEMVRPPSVTEATTRHLRVPAERNRRDV